MTKEELTIKLEKIYNNGDHDPESAHIQADNLLLEYINSKEVKQAYDKIDKWYA